jgi:hypothetical protein
MKKFILYFLLVLFFAGVATFIYGFLNGKKVRSFTAEVAEIQARHELAPQIEKIENNFRENGKKDISQIREESKQSSAELEAISRESASAEEEISGLRSPITAENLKNDIQEYYSKITHQATELKSIVDYMNQIIDVSAVFGEMQDNSSLDDMKSIISRAKEKGAAVKTDGLPQSLQVEAKNLKDAMNSFLLKIEEVANLKSEDTAALDESYQDFSQKEGSFFTAGKKYIDEMENLAIMEQKINVEIGQLGKVKFSLR